MAGLYCDGGISATGMPVELWLFANGERQMFLDGVEPITGRPIIPYGEHVLAILLKSATIPQGLLMFAAQCSPKPGIHGEQPADPSQWFLSQPDGTWKYSTTVPADDSWCELRFDDSQWQPMTEQPMAPPPEKEYTQQHHYSTLVKLGAKAIGVGIPTKTFWALFKSRTPVLAVPAPDQPLYVRRKFTLTEAGIQ